jgi:hypothetical protein
MSLSVYNLTELSIQLGNICILFLLSVLLNDTVIPTFIWHLSQKKEWAWNDTDRLRMEYIEKNMSKFYFIITNPIFTALGSNPGLCDERPVTNHLNHGNITYAYNTFTLLPPHYPVTNVSKLVRTYIFQCSNYLMFIGLCIVILFL